jgi:hypothetical protein
MDKYWAIEVPEGATEFGFTLDCLTCKLPDSKLGTYKWLYEADEHMNIIGGEWEIVCTLKDATYTQAAQIVESGGDGFKDYNEDNFHHDLPYMSPFDSLRSLMTAKGCDLNNNYLILKKG